MLTNKFFGLTIENMETMKKQSQKGAQSDSNNNKQENVIKKQLKKVNKCSEFEMHFREE